VTDRWTDEKLIELFDRVNNAGRWGADDELGTLNYITPECRRQAAALVQRGRTLSLERPLVRGERLQHKPFFSILPGHPLRVPPSAGEYLGLDVHQPGLTHLDCVSHIGSHAGEVYNGRRFNAVATDEGVHFGSVYAQRDGIVSRGVLLDVPAALEIDWLEPSHEISAENVEAAERLAGVRVRSGDVVVIRAGVEAREAQFGMNPLSPGPAPDLILWLHEREIAVYAGDAPERLTTAGAEILGLLPSKAADIQTDGPPTQFPLVLHQIGIPAMGLVLLDHCQVEELAAVCRELHRYEFLFIAAPLALPRGTGSPVNPLAIF
jgi:kynurenine formamidase